MPRNTRPENAIRPGSSRPIALTIAGSDSGGGAGIQADLHTFAAFGVHGVTAITAITAQNTRQVTAIQPVTGMLLEAQLDALFADFPIAAIKIGMLGSASIARSVAATLKRHPKIPVVLDPVLVATSGDALAMGGVAAALRRHLFPHASLLTPNIPEVEQLLGRRIDNADAMLTAAHALRELGAKAVLLKGGHAAGGKKPTPVIRDLLVTVRGARWHEHPRLPFEGHGTGCSLAAAIAAGLARGNALETAVADAIDFVQHALANAYSPGSGAVRVLDHHAAKSPPKR
ncbi:MAG: bifunctional hydroxymethylpyrimidine kinase/phosphomethylpyrimidine kinase [Dokdonella sp.]